MDLKFDVEAIADIVFKPTELTISFGIPYKNDNDEDVVWVDTDITEYKADGFIKRTTKQELPATVLNAITGYDVNTQLPKVDLVYLNALLANYNLRLI